MDFLELAQQRQSVRSYLSKPVESEKVERCLEASRLAPSACNAQPWRFIVIDDPALKAAVAQTSFSGAMPGNKFALEAPVLVAVVGTSPNTTSRVGGLLKDKPFYLMDLGMACEHFCLQAASEGLGTCMLGWFDEKKAKEILGVPRIARMWLLISLGYPREEGARPKSRKPLGEIASYNRY